MNDAIIKKHNFSTAEKISGVYKITNTITGDFYIGSSKNVKHRLANHKCKSNWNEQPNSPLYKDMQKYGLDKFAFQILEVVEPEELKEKEQKFIETLKPTYNRCNAKGLNIEKFKKSQNKYNKSNKGKESKKKYRESDKGKESNKKYYNQLCSFNGETLTLCALSGRFRRKGIDHPTLEAKKYLINN